MEETSTLKISAGVRLDINRDSEVLNQFVRVNLDGAEPAEGDDQKAPLKTLLPRKPEALSVIKAFSSRRPKEEKKVSFEPHHQDKQQQKQQLEQEQQQQQEDEQKQQESSSEEKQEHRRASQDEEKPRVKISPKQLKEELKRRRKKRKRPKPEEIYTDKDRAAAVNMGTRDIKQSLRIKRKQDRSRVLQIPEEAEPSTFLALGNCEMSRGDTGVALMFFNKALELNPAEKNSLVARSRCYLLLGQPENGLQDAEAALAVDKNFLKAIYQKAEALYYLGDFEHSLMYYHRGLRIRPEQEGFHLGVQKAQKAIENAIGGAFPGTKHSATLSSTRKSSSKSQTKETMTSPSSSSKAPPSKTIPESKASDRTPSQRSTSIIRAKTANRRSRLLRELQTDKEYLDNLLKHPDLRCKHKEDDSAIIGYIQEAVDFLNVRQEFWKQQLPTCK